MSYLEKAKAVFNETKAALELLYGELNQGQQLKLLKNGEVKNLLLHYGVVEENQDE